MRDVEHRTQHIADTVAGAHRHAAGEWPHRQPRADLAVEAGSEIFRIGLDPRQPAAKQRQPVQCLSVSIGIGLAGADALDAVVDRANTGRQPQPFGRVHRDRGVEHHRARDDPRMPEQLLDPVPLVGDAGDGAEFACRQCRRHRDLPHRGRVAGRRPEDTARSAYRAERRRAPRGCGCRWRDRAAPPCRRRWWSPRRS